jgi:hypothetical protein
MSSNYDAGGPVRSALHRDPRSLARVPPRYFFINTDKASGIGDLKGQRGGVPGQLYRRRHRRAAGAQIRRRAGGVNGQAAHRPGLAARRRSFLAPPRTELGLISVSA